MASVFLSYAHEDASLAKRVEATLNAGGFDVWRDLSSTRAGAEIVAAVARAIETADFFVPLLSPHSVASQFFQYELDLAVYHRNTQGNLVVAPLMAGECEIPSSIKNLQCFDLHGGADDALERIGGWLGTAERLLPRMKFELAELDEAELQRVLVALPRRALASLSALAVQLDLPDTDLERRELDDAGRVAEFFATAAKIGKAGDALRMLQKFETNKPKVLADVRARRAEALGRPSIVLSDFSACWREITGFRRQLAEVLERPELRATVERPFDRYEVAIVGAFSAGKSTLINALIGRSVLPETNQACTPCPTFVHKLTSGRERAVATNFTEHEMSSMMTRMLAKAAVQDLELERMLGEGRWAEFAMACPRQTSGQVDGTNRRAIIEEFLLPTASALQAHAGALGAVRELELSELSRLRAPGPHEATEQLLLKRIDVYVDAPALTDDVCLVDTPGVTSQNPAHKEFAFAVVQRCHALVVVEPFNAPLGEGPDAVMDAFYSRLGGSGTVGSSTKVFVVLNKCDLSEYDTDGTSKAVQSTVESVRRKYSTSWGVPRDRYFPVSGLVFLEELQGEVEAPSKAPVDPLLLEFRRFKGRLHRYLVDAIEKQTAADVIVSASNDIQAFLVEQRARIESLDADSIDRVVSVAELNEKLRKYRDGLAQAEKWLKELPQRVTDTSEAALKESLDSLEREIVARLNEFWAVSKGLGNAVFDRWFTAVYSDELPLRTRAVLHSWASSSVPDWVRNEVQIVVANLVDQIEGTEQRRSLPPPAPRRHLTEAFFEKLPGVTSFRTQWDVICVQDNPPDRSVLEKVFLPSARDRLERRVQWFLREVFDQVRDIAPEMAEMAIDAYATRGLERLSGPVHALEGAIVEAQRDSERSEQERRTRLVAATKGLEQAGRLRVRLDEIRAQVDSF
jgi:hypothetical protein